MFVIPSRHTERSRSAKDEGHNGQHELFRIKYETVAISNILSYKYSEIASVASSSLAKTSVGA